MKPRSDLCEFCQKSMTTFTKLRGCSEADKAEFIKKCQDHLNVVNIERTVKAGLLKDPIADGLGQASASGCGRLKGFKKKVL
ncbi:hypothetical protein J6590_077836 [Homalodisca vitripennis]|nr:hypothetical protein J6590_077836 [Homalodisca vitripennis]